MELNPILIGGALLLLLIVVIFISALGRKEPKQSWKQDVKKKVFALDNMAHENDPYAIRNALYEIDKLLDYVLIQKRAKGETLGERLKNGRNLFSKAAYNNVWEGHKLRNKLAHEFDFQPEVRILKDGYSRLRSGLNELLR